MQSTTLFPQHFVPSFRCCCIVCLYRTCLVIAAEINGTHGRIRLMPGAYSGDLGRRSGVHTPSMRSTFLRGSSLTEVGTTIAARRSPCLRRCTRSDLVISGRSLGARCYHVSIYRFESPMGRCYRASSVLNLNRRFEPLLDAVVCYKQWQALVVGSLL